MASSPRITDTIPRASIEQVLDGLSHLSASGGVSTFDGVRLHLLKSSKRRAPANATALWTVARDVLTELEKLQLAKVGILPRRLSDVDRLRGTPCQITADGTALAVLASEKVGRAFDSLLLRWLSDHSYFRALVRRLLRGSIYVPDVTNLGQLGLRAGECWTTESSVHVIENCLSRLQRAGGDAAILATFKVRLEAELRERHDQLVLAEGDAKRLIDLVQDSVIIPSLLEAESLPFDPVTFYQMLKCGSEFLCLGWAASHPLFTGRVVFSTCDFKPDLATNPNASVHEVVHHGVSFAGEAFPNALRTAYSMVAGPTSGYANAHSVRAVVCSELRVPAVVFARCLESVVAAGPASGITVYTELPFEPPPPGEDYIVLNKRRVGKLKII